MGAHDGRLSIFSKTGRQLLTTRLEYDIDALAVSRSGGRILAGTIDGGITLINGANGEPIWTAKADSDVTDVAMSADGQVLMAQDDRGNVLYLDTDGSIVRQLKPDGEIRQIALTGDGTRLAFGLADGQVLVLDAHAAIRQPGHCHPDPQHGHHRPPQAWWPFCWPEQSCSSSSQPVAAGCGYSTP